MSHPPVRKNDILRLSCTAVNESGDGIGRIGSPDSPGYVIFCKGLLPGETGSVKIINVTASYAIGRLMEAPDTCGAVSALRREVTCPYVRAGCGGCAFPHVTHTGQLELADARVSDCLRRIGGLEAAPELIKHCLSPAPGDQRRNKTVYPFFELNGRVAAGFFARASHRSVPFAEGVPCPHESAAAQHIRETVTTLADRFKLSVYNESTGTGLLRHLTVRVSDRTGRALAILTVNGRALPDEANFCAALTAACPELASLYLCVNQARGNAVLGSSFRLLADEPRLECFLGPARFLISPASFFQVSTAGAELLYDTVFRFAELRPGDKVLDLYCGVGTIGLYLLRRFYDDNNYPATGTQALPLPQSQPQALPQTLPQAQAQPQPLPLRLTGIELVPDAVDDARRNAVINGIDTCEFIAGDVPAVLEGIDPGEPDLVIIDPPRKGTDPTLINSLRRLSPARLIYVSCNPATLARDLKLLCADGAYNVRAVQPVDMFPDTGHCEVVCCLYHQKKT